MKSRMMIQASYTDVRTGEQFTVWRSVRGWRLAVLTRAAALLSVSANRAMESAGRALIMAGVLGLVLSVSGCGGRGGVETRAEASGVAVAAPAPVAVVSATPRAVHLCGAPTKAGGACKRRVRAEGLRCWMHGGPGAAESDAEKK